MKMFLTAGCTYICPESPLSFLPAAREADSLLGMEPSVMVWSLVSGGGCDSVSPPPYFPRY